MHDAQLFNYPPSPVVVQDVAQVAGRQVRATTRLEKSPSRSIDDVLLHARYSWQSSTKHTQPSWTVPETI